MTDSQLLPLPDHKETRVLVGTATRKSLPILEAYLRSYERQDLPRHVKLDYCFVADWPDPRGADKEPYQYLKDWVGQRGGVVLDGGPTSASDFTDQHAQTHQWQVSAMNRVGKLKNRIFEKALRERYDHVFLADADLLLDPTTLQTLLADDVPVVAGVYWTHWQRSPSPEVTVHAGPQVWLRHPYELSGRGMDEAEFRRRLISRELVQVWGQGALTLIRTEVLRAGVSFSPFPGNQGSGLWQGEDRHFSLHCEARHIPMHADGWVDAWHCYHLPDDIAAIPYWEARLAAPHPMRATLGDLVNVVITPLEGVPQPDGRWSTVPPQRVRGRLGALALMPEIEEGLYELERGQSAIVPVHFPVSHEIPQFRGTKRLYRVTLVDCKPFRFAPVIERELWAGKHSGAWADTTQFTPEQAADRKGVARG